MPQTIFCIAFIIFIIVGLFAGPKIRQHRKKALIQSYIDDASKAELNKITSELRVFIISIYTIFGYMPTEEQVNQIVTDIASSSVTNNNDEIFEKMISYIPKTIPEPNSLDFNLFVSINIDKIVKKHIPQKWQGDIIIATGDYTDISEDELLNVVHRQKLMYSTDDIHLYRFNYAMFAYEAIYNCIQSIMLDDEDFTEEVRNDILQKILADAEEQGYYLSDEYEINN